MSLNSKFENKQIQFLVVTKKDEVTYLRLFKLQDQMKQVFNTFSRVCPAMPFTTARGRPIPSSTGPCSMWTCSMEPIQKHNKHWKLESKITPFYNGLTTLQYGQHWLRYLNITPNRFWVILQLRQCFLCSFYRVIHKSILHCYTTERGLCINI